MRECDKISDKKYTNNENESSKLLEKNINNNFDDETEELTLEDLAPDGGWGWMIAIAMIIVFVSIFFIFYKFIL